METTGHTGKDKDEFIFMEFKSVQHSAVWCLGVSGWCVGGWIRLVVFLRVLEGDMGVGLTFASLSVSDF